MLKLTIPGNPKPKQRPRKGKHGRFYSPSGPEERRVAAHIQFQLPLHFKRLTGDLKVTAVFHRKGKRQADGDNLAKLCFDSMNKLVFADDAQVKYWIVQVHQESDNPRTEITVEEL